MEQLTLLLAGSAAGLVAGMVGLAGGIVIVPALTYIYGQGALHDAIVVSWFAVLFNSVTAAVKQFQVRSAEERAELFAWSRFFMLGALVATPMVAIAFTGARHLVSPPLVAALQLCLAGTMLWPIAEVNGSRATHPAMDAFAGAMVGAVSTLIGVGGGTYTIAYMVYAGRRPFRDAIATANLTGLAIGCLSVAGYGISLAMRSSSGEQANAISGWGMVILIVSGVLFSNVGVRLSRSLPTKLLRKILVGVLAVSALRLLLS